MTTLVALLRGVNVAGKGRVPMTELRSLLSSIGLEDVRTYIQSGNVVFRSRSGVSDVAAAIEQQIAEAFGVATTVIVHTPVELREIADGNPFLGREPEPSRLHVAFLEAEPTAEAVGQLDPSRSPPDALAVRGRAVYLHLPNGAGRSKLTGDYLERCLGVRATVRNWNTLNALIELASEG